MKKIIEKYYRNLYKRQDLDKVKKEKYLKESNKIMLNQSHREGMERKIILQDLAEAINKQKTQKALGLDAIGAL